MKLSEKIVELRKANGMTQEELANICNVSRQSISKWEADIALPEMDKLLLIGDTFHASMDVLLKDELVLNQVKKNNSCGVNSIQNVEHMMYEGALIKESIRDDSIIDLSLNGIHPKYQTCLDTSKAKEKDIWDELIAYAKSLGVPDSQCDFLPENYMDMNYDIVL